MKKMIALLLALIMVFSLVAGKAILEDPFRARRIREQRGK